MSEILPATIKAYLETDYCVFGESPFVLRVGIANEPLAKLYKRLKTNCGAFVTAFNPFSNEAGESANTARQVELAKELNRRSLTFIDGIGKHSSGEWPAEASYFVLGLSLEAAKALGKKYDQNAVVWCGSDAIPELVLLR
jgi:sugar phosphate isomerase/epimerase